MSTFHERLSSALGIDNNNDNRYQMVMRLSVQSAILYEAHRSLKDKLPTLRPFQKKLALYDQAHYLLEGWTSILPHQREEIMWRTGTSKEPLDPETLFRRCRNIRKEVTSLAEQMQSLTKENEELKDMSHEELYNTYIQRKYDEIKRTNNGEDAEGGHKASTTSNEATGDKDSNTNKSSHYPPRFEFTHNNNLITYKMYFHKGELDVSFPPPDTKEIVVPATKPRVGLDQFIRMNHQGANASAGGARVVSGTPRGGGVSGSGVFAAAARNLHHHAGNIAGVFMPAPMLRRQHQLQVQQQRRRDLLQEVKEHMALLEHFEGIVDPAVLKKRKQDLFDALPPPPPPMKQHAVVNGDRAQKKVQQQQSAATGNEDRPANKKAKNIGQSENEEDWQDVMDQVPEEENPAVL